MPLAASYTVETPSHTPSAKSHCGRVVIFQSCDDSCLSVLTAAEVIITCNHPWCHIMKDRQASVNGCFENLMML